MNTNIFPDGYIINTPYLDIDKIKPFTQNWDVELGAIDKQSKLLIKIDAFHTPNLQCSKANYTAGIFIKGHSPKECVILSCFVTDGIINFQGKRLLENEMVISTYDTNLDLVANKDTIIYTIAVEKDIFYNICKNYFGCSYEDIRYDDKLLVKTNNIKLLQKNFEEWIRLYTDPNMLKLLANRYDKLEEEILHTILSMLDIKHNDSLDKRYKLLKEIKNIMQKGIKDDLKIYQITDMLGISQRTLEYLFKDQLGITPKQYYHALRMHTVRNMLLEQKDKSISISQIASSCGFHHQSHFSSIYKQMYGETPLQTLKKNIQ
jgi:AraC-like DNA-binding protein